MGDTVDVSNAIKRYAKFMMLQYRCAFLLRFPCSIEQTLMSPRSASHADILLVPPFDVKVVWLAHMIRVEMVRAVPCLTLTI